MNLVFAVVVAVCVALAPSLAQPSAQADANISRKFLTPIEHVVVLMLENRSFDHYLGLLKGKRPAVDGCLPDMAQCSNPRDPLDASSPSYPVTNRGINVQASPSHSVHGTTTQIFGASDPQTNSDTSDHEAFSLGAEDMRGFVRSYASVVGEAAAASVMDCLDPSHVPVLATLAEEFLLFDSWFASVPGPTEPNRCYAIAASSHGMSTNDVETMVRGLPNKTLFRQLTELQLDWRVYFELLPTTLMFKDMRHADARRRYFRMERFFEDVAAGDLPFYTWIEPNYYPTERRPADDQHPDHSVADGERLIKDVYEALRANEQLWGKTALLITYDEHGGFFDHVAPPNPVPSPDGLVNTAADPFDFQRLGVRVPTVVASPWVRRGHVESLRPDASGGAYEHSSLAATLAHHMVGPRLAQNQTAPHAVPFLSARDAWARPFAHVFQTLSAPRDGTPAVLPEPFYGAKGRTRYAPQKLNDLQQDLLLIVAGVANDGAFNETAVRSEWTDAQAVEYIRRQLGAYFPNAPLDA